MAQKPNRAPSLKRIGVDKANARIVLITSAAAFLVIFFLVASFSLFGTLTYQNRVMDKKKVAVTQLRSNLKARDSLVASYKSMASASLNFIGGTATGPGLQDGSNPKLILDALPSKYDFPALASSLEKIASEQKVEINSITGTDDEVSQSTAEQDKPTPVVVPFQIKVSGDYSSIQGFVDAFDRSIRPFQIQTLKLTGDQSKLSLELGVNTYYQPEKNLTIKTKVVK